MSLLYRNDKRSAVGLPFLFLINVFLAFVCAQASFAEQSDAIALLIGNAEYPEATASGDAPFKEAVTDAHALYDELVRRGFDVEIKENLGKAEMQRALNGFYDKIKPGATALIYFSGLAMQWQGKNYLLPVNAQVWTEANIQQEGFGLEKIFNELNSRGAKVKIAIIDGARKNPYEEIRLHRAPAGLASVTSPGSLVLLSAKPGALIADVASAGTSVFMRELLKELQVSGTLEDAFNRTQTDVKTATRNQQIPFVHSNLRDEIPWPKQPALAGKPVAKEPPLSPEPLPSSGGAKLPPEPRAKPIIKTDRPPDVTPAPQPAPPPPPPTQSDETADYLDALRKDTQEGYQDFLNKHPAGDFAVGAKKALEKLKDSSALEPEEVYQRGLKHARKGDYELALNDFDEAMRRNPDNAAALNDRCWVRAVVGRLNEAMKDCNEALRLGNSQALDSRGFVNLKLGLFNDAVSDYSAALVLDPNRASSLYGRGIANLRRGSADSAKSDISAAKALQQDIADEFARYGIK
jgi:tetratricopeptide (TPR) repeat protein